MTPPAVGPPVELAVGIFDFAFATGELTLPAGQPVVLSIRNSDAFPHTFTIDDVVDSDIVRAGSDAVIEFLAPAAGSYTFYCRVHGAQAMSGTLTVN